jgi:hypothetical protein
MDRDFESGYSTQSYIEVLKDQLPKCWAPGLVFIHDNTSIHTAKSVKKWFENNAIPVSNWPPYSPYLNLIENS